MEKQEFWDIYDEHKKPTGRTMKRNDWILGPNEYHLIVLGVLKRSDGRFLITKRKMNKAFGAGWWEVPGGGAMAGESSYEAVLREVREETGVDVSACDYKLALTYKRDAGGGDNYIVDVYTFACDFEQGDVHCQEEETDGFMIASAEEIAAFADEGIFLHFNSIKAVFA
ncbi:MAG: NUDIX hydrolase [Clostridiales bacterium]|nr:NUDIX hydrolase [Clostridiales bacterium]